MVGAVRDLDKMEAVAEIDEFDPELFTPMEVELNSFESVRKFCADLDEFKLGRPLDRLLCNAAVYQPSLPYAKWSVDGHEQQMQINFLSHFLMISILLPELTRAKDARVVLVGSVTGNDNTVGGGGVYPIADLKQLEGLKAGAKNPISMFDGYNFDGAKAYKDSKLCLMMTSNILHDKCAGASRAAPEPPAPRMPPPRCATVAPRVLLAKSAPTPRHARHTRHTHRTHRTREPAAEARAVLPAGGCQRRPPSHPAAHATILEPPPRDRAAGTTSRPASLSRRSTPAASPNRRYFARSGRGSASTSPSS